MEKFCLFEVHEYMDMYPHKEVRVIEGDDEISIGTYADVRHNLLIGKNNEKILDILKKEFK